MVANSNRWFQSLTTFGEQSEFKPPHDCEGDKRFEQERTEETEKEPRSSLTGFGIVFTPFSLFTPVQCISLLELNFTSSGRGRPLV
jgi:hypothetical protein